MELKHIFGPIPSRRLGTSLGVDLVPYKTCTFDCVYCECGATTNLTRERKEYIPTNRVIEELDYFLKNEPELDYITFSGSGEPTLHSGIGEIVDFLKENYSQYKIALLTNATLFYSQKNLIEEIRQIDLIVPSLDVISNSLLDEINRPVKGVTTEKIISGLNKLRKKYQGEIWLEIFIIPGLNDTKQEINLFKKVINQINPDRIQLNTLDRLGVDESIKSASEESLKSIASILGKKVEIIANFDRLKDVKKFKQGIIDDILTNLKKEPCTSQDLAKMLEIHINEVSKYTKFLLDNDLIKTKRVKGETVYYIK